MKRLCPFLLFAWGMTLALAAQGADAHSSPKPDAARAAVGSTATPSTNGLGTPMPSGRLHNLFRAAPGVFSGSSPEGDDAFAELARLGVKTVISVDGAKPDLAAARRHGLRYVHLPFGYDSIPARRAAELARAAQSVEGPIYVHCHHGLHRGPAAVAILCATKSSWTTNQAVAWLRQAGTSPDYPGLYRSAMTFQRPDAATLDAIVDLPESAPTSSVVDAMVAIDEAFERLKSSQKAGWTTVPGEPGARPVHTATLLWEQLRELGRLEDTARRPEDYRKQLAASEQAADRLREALRATPTNPTSATEAWQALRTTCTRCHQAHRN